MVNVILTKASVSTKMSEKQHALALEYLSITLSIRDREQLIKVTCHHSPDLVTQLLKDLVAAYDPMIRQVHQAVDLSGTVTDFEAFMSDFIKIGKLKTEKKDSREEQQQSSVQDFVKLLNKHVSSSHRFIHQVARNGKQVTEWFREYTTSTAAMFRQKMEQDVDILADQSGAKAVAAAGDMTETLNSIFAELSEPDRQTVLSQIDAHARYLSSLSQGSSKRLRAVVTESEGKAEYGPGLYLAKWQSLLDETPITPATMEGKVRYGSSESVTESTRKGVGGEKTGGLGVARGVQKSSKEDKLKAPHVRDVVRLMGQGFRDEVAKKGKTW